jgi:hypothetical protein
MGNAETCVYDEDFHFALDGHLEFPKDAQF